MARIKPVEVFDHFAPQVRAALDEAVDKALPGVEVDRRQFYQAFRRALSAKLRQWENVPAAVVDAD